MTKPPKPLHTDVLSKLEKFKVSDLKYRSDFDPDKQLVCDAALGGFTAYQFPKLTKKQEAGKIKGKF